MGANDSGKERRQPGQRRYYRLPRDALGAPPPQQTRVRSRGARAPYTDESRVMPWGERDRDQAPNRRAERRRAETPLPRGSPEH
ncbi:hypothetical protein NDU88_001997 [Pleurodeles waltl]|uniref:Uncharacterized protein n=1 Tax=Pleurodeles waltl TaxID=8319 RepID=A0AAV7MMJ6_PLEWA|nr:hypothetical protein NDU88_001997 [Pleurodeles waltl]